MYISRNEPEYFHWHDAELMHVSENENSLHWHVDTLNITKENSQNPDKKDLCADNVKISFKDYKIISLLSYGFERWQNGQLIERTEDRYYSESEILKFLEKMRQSSGWVCNLLDSDCIREDNLLHLGFDLDFAYLGESFFRLELICSEFTAEWETYSGTAWYEQVKQKPEN